MNFDSVRVPERRIAVIIGKKGKVRKEIEKKTKTKISVDSKEGIVEVQAREETGLGFYSALNIIKAIARGFSPEHAFLLLNENYYLEIIDLEEQFGKSKSRIKQKSGRVIGTSGKMRKEIEEVTSCFVSVFGKTVSIIGDLEGIQTAKRSIEMLLDGASHDTALKFLRKSEVHSEQFDF